jgi:hypothetical protein
MPRSPPLAAAQPEAARASGAVACGRSAAGGGWMSDKPVLFPATAILLAGLVIARAVQIFVIAAPQPFGVRLFFDVHDLEVYFNSSRWVLEGGRLYREVPSEYPLLANIIFAAFRFLSNLISPGLRGFCVIWIASACFIYYLCLVYGVSRGATTLALFAWLAPAPIYFSLFRFDLYPALATLMSLFAIRRGAYTKGALWLGVAAALKGYALFLLPTYCIFMVHQRGLNAAIKVGVLVVAPTILSLLATFAFAGYEGLVAPFNVHFVRTLNGESTYDALNYLFNAPVTLWVDEAPWIAHSLQVAAALAAAAMRPKRFEDLINSFLFAILGFMSFSTFYSPQFVLWVLPLICFSTSRVMLITTILFSWLTYFYSPISFDLLWVAPALSGLFKAAIITISLLRLIMMFLAARLTLAPYQNTVDKNRRSPSSTLD